MPIGNIQVKLNNEVVQVEDEETTGFRRSSLNVAERLYELLRAKRREFVPQRVYASQIKECSRKTVMALMGFKKGPVGENNPEWIAVADLGTWLHNQVEDWLREIGGLVKAEFNARSEDGTLSGRVDALLADTVTPAPDPRIKAGEDFYCAQIEVAGQQYILDLKTVKEKDFKAGLKGRKIAGYVAQISVYGRMLGVDKGIILLLNRNTGEMVDWEFDIDPEEADGLLLRAKTMYGQAKQRQLPEAEEWGKTRSGSYFCRNLCPFYRQCAEQQASGNIQRALDAGAEPEAL
jgi:hypothetical protein